MSIPQLLAHRPGDNVVVVVVQGLSAGIDVLCVITHDTSDFHLTARADIPIGHEVALKDLKAGDTVIKYGEDIGKMVGGAEKGAHAHVHNLKSNGW